MFVQLFLLYNHQCYFLDCIVIVKKNSQNLLNRQAFVIERAFKMFGLADIKRTTYRRNGLYGSNVIKKYLIANQFIPSFLM